MNTRALLFTTLFSLGGCFSPNAEDESDTEGTGETTDTATTDASTTGTSMTTMSDASGTVTTSTTTTTDPTDDGPATGTDGNPVCGDGTLDPGEECDDGVNNALGNACHPDCTLNVCGDGDVGPEETCDEGNNNALEIGACAPDCSKIIEVKQMRRYPIGPGPFVPLAPLFDGDLGPNPIEDLDAACATALEGSKALFAIPGERQAASSPNEPDPIDWVLQPYTAYVDYNDELVWITDAAPLLGVRGGQPMPLETKIVNQNYYFRVITGLNQDWTTAVSGTCDGWTSDSSELSAVLADETSTTEFLRSDGTIECNNWNATSNCGIQGQMFCRAVGIYCVEQ